MGLTSVGRTREAGQQFRPGGPLFRRSILSVMLLGMAYSSSSRQLYAPYHPGDLPTPGTCGWPSSASFPKYALEVFSALFPILLFFLIFQVFFCGCAGRQVVKIWWACSALHRPDPVPHRRQRGVHARGELPWNAAGFPAPTAGSWSPVGMVIGYYIVKAEPAVQVLNKQVEEITGGTIPAKTMMLGLSVGMAISLGHPSSGCSRVCPLYLLAPGYALALGLSFHWCRLRLRRLGQLPWPALQPTAQHLLFAMGACEPWAAHL